MPLRPRKMLQPRYLPGYALAALVLAISVPSAIGLAAGLAAVAAGVALRSWGAGHLVKTDRLTVSGPYAYLRHPLYAGTLLIAAGFALAVGGKAWLALPGLLLWFFLLYFPRKERIESARLERRYGEPYRRYRADVRPLRPRWHRWRPAPDAAAAIECGGRWARERFVANNEHATAVAVAAGAALLCLRWAWIA